MNRRASIPFKLFCPTCGALLTTGTPPFRWQLQCIVWFCVAVTRALSSRLPARPWRVLVGATAFVALAMPNPAAPPPTSHDYLRGIPGEGADRLDGNDVLISFTPEQQLGGGLGDDPPFGGVGGWTLDGDDRPGLIRAERVGAFRGVASSKVHREAIA